MLAAKDKVATRLLVEHALDAGGANVGAPSKPYTAPEHTIVDRPTQPGQAVIGGAQETATVSALSSLASSSAEGKVPTTEDSPPLWYKAKSWVTGSS